ncbi:hypothetical protein ACJDU8_21025 [Clostridium sp. WILCCON 0269]|uniref:Membrane-anchored protein n=1 Tax=Candidatus Clostridium eludens TaxID=3381663 RepID=A0ABW8SPN8_9CLOT
MSERTSNTMHYAKHMLTKVPEITAYFWIIKVLSTGMGEVTSDYLAKHMNPVIAVVLTGISLVVSLVIQFSVNQYVAWIYWLNVVIVSIFGTMAADVLHVGFGIPYIVSTLFFLVVLIIIFSIWYISEKTLSIHSIYTFRRELFYWAVILATFALGTAAGDMTASTMHLGYFFSGILFSLLIAVPALAYLLLELNEIFAFWFAYIVTRPLGASLADWAGMSHSRGGLGLGTGSVSLGLTIIILGLVAYMMVTRKDIRDSEYSTS